MRWGAKPTDTTKVSIEARYIVADRTLAVLGDLKKLRASATQRASAEDIGTFAESRVLFPAAPDWYIGHLCSDAVTTPLLDQADFDAAEPVAFHDEDVTDLDAFYDDMFSDEEAHTGPPSPDFSGSDVDDRDTSRTADDEPMHILATPWSASFPAQLESHLDRAEQRVSADQLIRLQSCIDETDEFHEHMLASIRENKAALNRRQARYRMREAGGDMAGFMKSGGLGSPLVDVVGVDEEWLDDPWDIHVRARQRRKIFHGAGTPPGPPMARV
ncbi:hypothetical protein AK830_g8727 [Neonectria ditissima]|uniref:Uncharacterized protein n=1 Tax=Neonectria ditissima TaxID=78410 RepID=A0A0P7BDM2_9HYPO|nr:hypothetical protein AK830_g8727 [Neonectria ditissima]